MTPLMGVGALLLVVMLLIVGAPPAAAGDVETVRVVAGTTDGSLVVEEVPAHTAPQAIRALEADPGIAFAEVDVPVSVTGAAAPDDPLFSYQWGPVVTRATEAWADTAGVDASDVVIAVVDTGVDADHLDLGGAVLPGLDLIGGGTDDPHGHGTAVAGVAGARGGNGIGVAGYCWSCSILPVRALDATGNGSAATVATGVRWAADQGADIINLSLAGAQESQALSTAITYARSKGSLVVAAAGNDGSTALRYPAASPDTVAVVAATETDRAYDWASRGLWTDVAGPGCAVSTETGGSYDEFCGSSLASPAVAGAAALALAVSPDLGPADLEAALHDTGVPLADRSVPHGRLDVSALLAAVDPDPESPLEIERVSGPDRIATSVAISRRQHPAADSVVIARADLPADALLAAPVASSSSAPVLLTAAGSLPAPVADEVRRLGATTARIVGGTSAVGPDVEQALRAAGIRTVERFEGATRFDTAAHIAHAVGGSRAYVTSADAWADAVAVSGLSSYAGAPILLVGHDVVPDVTERTIRELGITELTVVGGRGVISDAVVRDLGRTGAAVQQIAGADRYATSAAIAAAAMELGADPSSVWMATGTTWPDALTAGPAAARSGGVLLLVPGATSTPSSDVASWLAAHAGGRLVVVGGERSVRPELVDALMMAAGAAS